MLELFLKEEYKDFVILEKEFLDNGVKLTFWNRSVSIFEIKDEFTFLVIKVTYSNGFKEVYRTTRNMYGWRYF